MKRALALAALLACLAPHCAEHSEPPWRCPALPCNDLGGDAPCGVDADCEAGQSCRSTACGSFCVETGAFGACCNGDADCASGACAFEAAPPGTCAVGGVPWDGGP